MDIYLPIAEVSVNWPFLVLLGAMVGFVSGLFGIGGGFLMAPILIFLGIPPAVAVASQASHVVASSTSGVINYAGKKAIDFKIGSVMAVGGVLGALLGVELFRYLRLLGQADLAVALSYLLFLGAIGLMMLYESLGAILRRVRGEVVPHKERRRPLWLYGLPFKMKFPRSGLYISAIPPLVLGMLVGILSAIMGVGGGFIQVPLMNVLMRVPVKAAAATSAFMIGVTVVSSTLLYYANGLVNPQVAVPAAFGVFLGSQTGSRLARRVRGRVLSRILIVILLYLATTILLQAFGIQVPGAR